MPFSLVDARACFDREASVVAQVISSTIPLVCLSWTKKKQTNKKESGWSHKRKKKQAQASKKGTVYLTTVKKAVHGFARVANFMKPLHLALMHSCPKITTVLVKSSK